MPGPRQKLSVLEGNGRKHLSKAEKARRAAQEVELPKPKTMRLPKWLPEEHRKEFRTLARELLAADMGAAQLDRDTLGRYVVAQAQYAQACKMAGEALTAKNAALAEKWTKIQDTCFKQARACANDMGMTITSRCRLVLPEGAKKKEKNPFEQMMEERMRRA
ncbi:phage terminase small subunit P27 family [uncultured Flavonifractor sp.]|uniref:phage terminase small subunit P27 family n=1 Tax=uncultured Flavonifractor sp. TaxID=1193534 RepID=UPI0026317F33|nr:phage terminase small subunit P27 family [uncultured Flavonifractor sp.]